MMRGNGAGSRPLPAVDQQALDERGVSKPVLSIATVIDQLLSAQVVPSN